MDVRTSWYQNEVALTQEVYLREHQAEKAPLLGPDIAADPEGPAADDGPVGEAVVGIVGNSRGGMQQQCQLPEFIGRTTANSEGQLQGIVVRDQDTAKYHVQRIESKASDFLKQQRLPQPTCCTAFHSLT